MGTFTDDELMEKIRGGDAAAFAQLYDRHASAVFGYCLFTLGGNHAMADDISQEAWLKVARNAAKYECRGTFKAWLMTITRNETVSQIRRQLPAEELEEETPVPIEDGAGIEEALQGFQNTEKLRQAVAALPDSQRLALMLWLEEESTYAGIAEKMGVGESVARGLLERAKRGLRQKLEKNK